MPIDYTISIFLCNARTNRVFATKDNKMWAFGQRNKTATYVINDDLQFSIGDEPANLERFGNALGECLGSKFPAMMQSLIGLEKGLKKNSVTGNYARSIAISHNLKNESHYDSKDGGYGASIWIQKDPSKNVENWYFVLPNCSIKGSRGVAIKLYHGIQICWNGSELKHCTMDASIDENDSLYGCFMAPKADFCNNTNGTVKPKIPSFNRNTLQVSLQNLLK